MQIPAQSQILAQNDLLKEVARSFSRTASADNFQTLRLVTFEAEGMFKWLHESSRDQLFIRECCSAIRGLGAATLDVTKGKPRAAGFLVEDVFLALIRMLRCRMIDVWTTAQIYPPRGN